MKKKLSALFSRLAPGICFMILISAAGCVHEEIDRSLSGIINTPVYEFSTSKTNAGWEFLSYNIRQNDQGISFATKGKGFALPLDEPFGNELAIRTQIRIEKAITTTWKIAGLALYLDNVNYWQLAFVEPPDESLSTGGAGQGHYIELAEMYKGAWFAQNNPATKLTLLENKTSFNWEYNRIYELLLVLAENTIRGYVFDTKGNLKASAAYSFDREGLVFGKPGLVSEGFITSFPFFETRIAATIAYKKETIVYPPYKEQNFSVISDTTTGFFHLVNRNGIDWLIDPLGAGFFIIGTDHVSYFVHWSEKLGYAQYHRNVDKKYGSEKAWADATGQRLSAWGFNSLGTNSSSYIRYKKFAYQLNLNWGTGFTEYAAITPKTTWTGFPDVFDPDFENYCRAEAKTSCLPLKDDPWLVGYFSDNELEWHAWTGKGLFADTFAQTEAGYAKKRLVALFTDHYKTIAEYNRGWNPQLKNFSDLYTLRNAPLPMTPQGEEIISIYTRLVADTYFSTVAKAIKEYDPNHLYLGCRFAGQAPDIWDIAGRYCDIISVNCYRSIDLETGAFTDGFDEELSHWHDQARKPLMITEWSFPALDAGLPCRHGAGQRVPTQADRSFAFTSFQKYLFTQPYIVGSNYFMWADEPETGISKVFPEDSNYGLVNLYDEPYQLLTEAATALHPNVYRIHSGDTTDAGIRPGQKKDEFIISNAGKCIAEGEAVFRFDDRQSGYREEKRRYDLFPGSETVIKAGSGYIDEPGMGVIFCSLFPLDPLLETDNSNNNAYQIVNNPPALSTTNSQAVEGVQIPISLILSGENTLQNVPISAAIDTASDEFIRKTNLILTSEKTGKQIPFQIDTGESVAISFIMDRVEPFSANGLVLSEGKQDQIDVSETDASKIDASIFDDASAFTILKKGKLFSIQSGNLKMERKNDSGGKILDRIELSNTLMGSFNPLLWEYSGIRNSWIAPDTIEEAVITEGKIKTILEITASYKGKENQSKKYRVKTRVTFFKGKEWCIAEYLWIENLESLPWQLKGYYFYTLSSIAGYAGDDEDAFDRWVDKNTGLCFGVIPRSGDVSVRFWKDNMGGEHPDAFVRFEKMLEPNMRYQVPDASVFIACGENRKWFELMNELKGYRKIRVEMVK